MTQVPLQYLLASFFAVVLSSYFLSFRFAIKYSENLSLHQVEEFVTAIHPKLQKYFRVISSSSAWLNKAIY